jgi:RHS repeat-associated protein
MTVQILPGSSATYFQYDALGQRLAVTDALGHSAYFQYDAAGQQTASVDALGYVTYYYYDAVGRQYAVRDAAGGLVYYAYDALSRHTALTDQRGNTSYFAYDAASRLITELDPLGNAAYYLYDAEGRVTGRTDALGATACFIYDAAGRLTATVDATGQPTYFLYDATGNRTAAVDGLGKANYFYYDNLRRLACVEDAQGSLTYYNYGVGSVLESVTDGRGNVTEYAHDALARTMAVADPLGRTEYFTYDPASRVLSSLYPDGQATYFSYDLVGHRSAIVYPNGDFVYFAHDGRSALAAARDARGWTYFTYDAAAGLTCELPPDGCAVYHSYDAIGLRTCVSVYGASATYYQYDEAGRMTVAQSSIPELGAAYYEYDAASRLAKKVLGNGCFIYYAYDAAGRATQLLNCLPDGSPLAYFEYAYDGAGRLVRCLREGGNLIYYGYDEADRLTGEHWYDSSMTALYAFQWGYDAVGNRMYEYRDGQETYYEYDAANQLLRTHDASADAWTYFAYDTCGDCTVIQEPDGTTYFTYNPANLVTSILFKDGSSNYFHYDAQQRRYALEEPTGLRYFTWDANGMNLLCERDARGNVVAQYSHGYTPTNGIGSMVCAKSMQGGTYYQWPAYDQRGSVFRLTDQDAGPPSTFEYDAWGGILSQATVGQAERFGYQSNWVRLDDPDRCLWLSPVRVYNALRGLFLAPDLASPTVGWHSYAYAGGAPTIRVDPTGLKFEDHGGPKGVGSLSGNVHVLSAGGVRLSEDCMGNVGGVNVFRSVIGYTCLNRDEHPEMLPVVCPGCRNKQRITLGGGLYVEVWSWFLSWPDNYQVELDTYHANGGDPKREWTAAKYYTETIAHERKRIATYREYHDGVAALVGRMNGVGCTACFPQYKSVYKAGLAYLTALRNAELTQIGLDGLAPRDAQRPIVEGVHNQALGALLLARIVQEIAEGVLKVCLVLSGG